MLTGLRMPAFHCKMQVWPWIPIFVCGVLNAFAEDEEKKMTGLIAHPRRKETTHTAPTRCGWSDVFLVPGANAATRMLCDMSYGRIGYAACLLPIRCIDFGARWENRLLQAQEELITGWIHVEERKFTSHHNEKERSLSGANFETDNRSRNINCIH